VARPFRASASEEDGPQIAPPVDDAQHFDRCPVLGVFVDHAIKGDDGAYRYRTDARTEFGSQSATLRKYLQTFACAIDAIDKGRAASGHVLLGHKKQKRIDVIERS